MTELEIWHFMVEIQIRCTRNISEALKYGTSCHGGDHIINTRNMALHGGDHIRNTRHMALHGIDYIRSNNNMELHGGDPPQKH